MGGWGGWGGSDGSGSIDSWRLLSRRRLRLGGYSRRGWRRCSSRHRGLSRTWQMSSDRLLTYVSIGLQLWLPITWAYESPVATPHTSAWQLNQVIPVNASLGDYNLLHPALRGMVLDDHPCSYSQLRMLTGCVVIQELGRFVCKTPSLIGVMCVFLPFCSERPLMHRKCISAGVPIEHLSGRATIATWGVSKLQEAMRPFILIERLGSYIPAALNKSFHGLYSRFCKSVWLWVMRRGCGHADTPLLQELRHNVGREVGSIITIQDGGAAVLQNVSRRASITAPASNRRPRWKVVGNPD